MKAYNGHRSWNAWNVALWIGSDEDLYRTAIKCMKEATNTAVRWRHGKITPLRISAYAARLFREDIGCPRTPDGAYYNRLSVQLALIDLM